MMLVVIYARQPKRIEANLELVYCCTFINFQLGWLIYGNAIVFSSGGLACKDLNSEAMNMWVLAIISVIWGYFLFLFYLILFLATISLLITVIYLRREVRNNAVVDRVPDLNALNNLRR